MLFPSKNYGGFLTSHILKYERKVKDIKFLLLTEIQQKLEKTMRWNKG
jgi:hypothetical protein